MRYASIFACALPIAMMTAPSVALAKRSKARPVAPAENEITLPVPTSEIELRDATAAALHATSVEVGVSSYLPSRFTRPTFTSGENEFGMGSYPFISMNRVARVLAGDEPTGAYWKIGLATMSLRRTVLVNRGAGVFSAAQDLSLLALRFGAEYKGPRFAGIAQPYVGVAALPMAAFASQSQLEESLSAYGLPFEGTAGVELFVPALQRDVLGFKRIAIGLGAQALRGSIGGSSVDGIGGQGYMRVEL